MAYRSRGLPSTGCNRCRSRKVKCDEEKPICRRCQKAGYGDCKFRDEFERTWRWNSGASVESAPAAKQQLIRFAPLITNAEKILISPTNNEILSRFFHDWAVITDKTPGLSISWFNGLRPMYSKAQSNELVYKSITALAHASYGRRFNKPKLLADAGVWCVETLQMLRTQLLSNPAEISCRELKVTIILMGIYETIVASDISKSWMSHMSGAMMMLNLRSNTAMGSQPADFEISVMIIRQMIHGCMMSGQAPLAPKVQMMQLFPKALLHNYNLTELSFDIVLLCSRWRLAISTAKTIPDYQALADIAELGLALHGRLVEWARTLPPEFKFIGQSPTINLMTDWLRPMLEGAWAPSSVHYYPTPVIRMLWRSYWVAELILSQALIFTHTLLQNVPTVHNPLAPVYNEISSSLLSAMDRLCESCLSPLALPPNRTVEGRYKDTIPSLEGYLLLQVLPVLGLAVDQVCLEDVDLSARKAWVYKMGQCIKGHFGLAKAAINTVSTSAGRMDIQIWGVGTRVGVDASVTR